MKTENILIIAGAMAAGYLVGKKKEDGAIGALEMGRIAGMYPNYHVIKVTYIGASNTRGSRVKMLSERFEQSKTIDYNYSFNNTYEIAEDWLTKNGFEIVGHAEGKDCYYIITNTFKPFKESISGMTCNATYAL